MADVYRFITPDGQEFDWHRSVAELREAWPGAVITHRLVPDAIRGGAYESFTTRQAQAAERKAAEPAPAEEAVSDENAAGEAVLKVARAARDKAAKDAESSPTTTTTAAPAVAVEEAKS